MVKLFSTVFSCFLLSSAEGAIRSGNDLVYPNAQPIKRELPFNPFAGASSMNPDFSTLEYYHPSDKGPFVSAYTTIGIRTGDKFDRKKLTSYAFDVNGKKSGRHMGSVKLALDEKTILFVSNEPYAPSETVTVHIRANTLTSRKGIKVKSKTWSFFTSPQPHSFYFQKNIAVHLGSGSQQNFNLTGDELLDYDGSFDIESFVNSAGRLPTERLDTMKALAEEESLQVSSLQATLAAEKFPAYKKFEMKNLNLELPAEAKKGTGRMPRFWYKTVPSDLPFVLQRVQSVPGRTSLGKIFASPVLNPTRVEKPDNWGNWILIFDHTGDLVFYRKLANGAGGADFKVQEETGKITYRDRMEGLYVQLGKDYKKERIYESAHGYIIDGHGLQVRKDGSFLCMIEDRQPYDLSTINPSWPKKYDLVGAIVQYLDKESNVLFEWRLWDHFTPKEIIDLSWKAFPKSTKNGFWDLTHINSVEFTNDDHILIGFRHFGLIKVNRHNGKTMWQFGGKPGTAFNQFQIKGDNRPFSYSHDGRQLKNGRITLYDNGNANEIKYSRAVEYVLDEKKGEAKLVWEYRSKPDRYGWATGSHQTLPNGNKVINWGGVGSPAQPFYTEVNRQGQIALEMQFEVSAGSYRAFKMPWIGNPSWSPRLFVAGWKNGNDMFKRLHFSWNGATEVGQWKVYCAANKAPEESEANLKMTIKKIHFEHVYTMTNPKKQFCKVVAIDKKGKRMDASPSKQIV